MVEEKTRTVSALIDHLHASKDHHLELLGEVLVADGGRLFGVDLVVCAVLQRSLCLINGFCMLIEQRNLLCAAPLLRLQVDSLIRLYACWLVKEPHSIAEHLLQDRPLNKVKSRDGQPLTDKYLWTKAAEHYPWVGDVYKATSGFIHLSAPHMLSGFRPDPAAEGENTTFIFASKEGPEWSEGQLYEAVAGFCEATRSLFHLCWSWLDSKNRVASTRAAKEEPGTPGSS